jgi:trk system potassium uptake protein TrkA
MHVIIVGGGEIGFALAQALSTQHDVVVIDHAPAVADRFDQVDAQFLLGAATSADLLGRAGVEKADVLVACTGLDEVNIVACALANRLGQPRTFCFVSREEFLDLPQDQKGLAVYQPGIWPKRNWPDIEPPRARRGTPGRRRRRCSVPRCGRAHRPPPASLPARGTYCGCGR